MLHYVIPILFAIVLLTAWGALCFSKYKKWNHRRKNCNKELQVYVKQILERKTKRGDIVYKPIFAWNEAGREYTIDSAFYSGLVSFEVGEAVMLLVNPENYMEFLYADDTYNKGILADVLGCLMPLLLILGLFSAMIIN